MNEDLRSKIRSKIINEYLKDKENTDIRNEIYLLIKDDIIKWIKSILGSWGNFEDEGEILSLSFDSFLFCLGHYKSKFTVDFHFYNYTKYFLLKYYAAKGTVNLPIEELKETFSYVKTPTNIDFENFLTLLQFREIIPEKYKIVWDDACQSIHATHLNDPNQTTSKKTGMSNHSYRTLKKCFIPIIKFILKK